MSQPFNLPTADDVAELAQACRAAGAGDGLLILDTLNRAALGLDENAVEDMGAIIEAAADLQRRIGGTVLAVHHSGKDLTRGMRGHSSLHAALDAAIEVRRDGDAREWRIAKSKDGADAEGIAFRLEVETLGIEDDGTPYSSCVVVEERPSEQDNAPAKAFLEAQTMRQVLTLLHETFQAGDYLSPSATAPVGTPWAVLRHMEGFPARMRKPELTGLFRAMQKAGHIRREGYTKPNRHPGERWAITAAGYAFAGIAAPAEQEPKTEIAPTAPTCHVSEVDAPDAGASSALRRHTGGYRGRLTQRTQGEATADNPLPGATQTAPTAEVGAEEVQL
nr:MULTISPECIES: AAA family ATPase [unclassified Thiomonas]